VKRGIERTGIEMTDYQQEHQHDGNGR